MKLVNTKFIIDLFYNFLASLLVVRENASTKLIPNSLISLFILGRVEMGTVPLLAQKEMGKKNKTVYSSCKNSNYTRHIEWNEISSFSEYELVIDFKILSSFELTKELKFANEDAGLQTIKNTI